MTRRVIVMVIAFAAFAPAAQAQTGARQRKRPLHVLGCAGWHAAARYAHRRGLNLRQEESAWACTLVPDERAALENEIARLQRENGALKKDMLARGLPLPGGVASAPSW